MPGAAIPSTGDERHDPLAGRRVVHLVGHADAERVDHLAAMTRVLLARGVPQTVVLVDDTRRRALLPRFDAGVRLVLAGASRWRSPRALLSALRAEVGRERTAAVHAHGLMPCLLGIFAARFLDLPAPLHFSFHGRRPRPVIERAVTMLWRVLAPAPSTAPAAAALQTDWLESDVADAFFDSGRRESRRPLVVTACREPDARHAARFAQLAVLLESTGIAFNWLGPADSASLARFAAAGVGHFEAQGEAERAARLRPAWVYVDSGGAAQPTRLAEAMAVGLPCAAWDSAANRALLEHGRTGLLCDSDDGLLAALAQLVDSAELRARLGAAARAQAFVRFSRAGRGAALLASYRIAAARAAASTGEPVAAAADTAADLPLASPDR